MARRNSGKEFAGLGVLIVIGAVVFAVSKAVDSIGFTTTVVAAILVIVGMVWFKIAKRAKRLAYLRGKYGDESIVQHIMSKTLWQGETAEQVRDSIGMPSSMDNNLLKTRKREVWKYHPHGRGRYRLRVTLDNDVVIEIKTLGH
jgi:hypothetical protein